RGDARGHGGATAARAPGLVPGRRRARGVGRRRGGSARARHDPLRALEARPAPPHAGAPALLMSAVVDVDSHVWEPAVVWERYLDRDYRVLARSAFWHDVDERGIETTVLNGRRVRALKRSGINRQA